MSIYYTIAHGVLFCHVESEGKRSPQSSRLRGLHVATESDVRQSVDALFDMPEYSPRAMPKERPLRQSALLNGNRHIDPVSLRLLGRPTDAGNLGSAVRASTLGCGAAVLQCNLFGVFHLNHLAILDAVSLWHFQYLH